MFFVPCILLIHITSSYSQEFIAPVFELGGYVAPLPSGMVASAKPPKLPSIDFENRVGENEEKPVVPPSFVLGSNTPISSIPAWTPSQVIPPGEPWPTASTGSQVFTNRFGENTQTSDKVTNLDYKPTRPSFHPNPGNNIHQIIPSGPPLPSAEKTTTQSPGGGFIWSNVGSTVAPFINRFGEKGQGSDKVTVLDYKPTRPSFHPNPGNNINTIIPPGTPWPAGPLETTKKPDLSNRIQDTEENNSMGAVYANQYQDYYPYPQKPVMSLEYKPSRPFYAGQPKQ